MGTQGADPYATGDHRWWHLSIPSPELLAVLGDGWLHPPDRVLDLGCGLGTEVSFLSDRGFETVGLDLSLEALRQARAQHRSFFVQGDATQLPFASQSFDVLLDRGCLHYIAPSERVVYEREAKRVLRVGGRLLLRACLCSQGAGNDLSLEAVRATFPGWRFGRIEEQSIPSDTRSMDAVVARLEVAAKK